MALSASKHKLSDPKEVFSQPKKRRDDLIYIAPAKIQKKRLELMKKSALKKGLPLAEAFSVKVSHVATACDTGEQLLKALKVDSEVWCEDIIVVKLDWMTDCLRQGQVMPVLDKHRISMETVEEETDEPAGAGSDLDIPEWICQRANPLKHFNEELTKPLELLEKNALFYVDSLHDSRALAFRRGSATLRSLPRPVRHLKEVEGLPNIGKHCKTVIKDVLSYGYSQEAEHIEQSANFQKLKIFTGIFGVGPKTAWTWIGQGLNTLKDVRNSPAIVGKENERMAMGLAFYEDLNLPVLKSEADVLAGLIRAEAQALLPGCMVVLVGGFRRGKPQGHDIDLLISHPEEGREQGLLQRLLLRLQDKDLLLSGRHESSSFHHDVLKNSQQKGEPGRSTLDYFEKWLGVMKVKKSLRVPAASEEMQAPPSGGRNPHSLGDPQSLSGTLEDGAEARPALMRQGSYNTLYTLAKSERDWYARRVDLIIVPASQYYWALVGWTGSRQFNRSLRTYAPTLNMVLTSHGLWDRNQGRAHMASSEKEVFDILGLPYHEPHLRNA